MPEKRESSTVLHIRRSDPACHQPQYMHGLMVGDGTKRHYSAVESHVKYVQVSTIVCPCTALMQSRLTLRFESPVRVFIEDIVHFFRMNLRTTPIRLLAVSQWQL